MDKDVIIKTLNTKNLLIVDDDGSTLLLLQKLLSRYFKHVYIAENGLLGLKTYKCEAIDCILTDVTMPECDGIELATKVREINKDIVVIFMTGHNETSYIEKFKTLECNSVTKPVVLEDLMKIFMDYFH